MTDTHDEETIQDHMAAAQDAMEQLVEQEQ